MPESAVPAFSPCNAAALVQTVPATAADTSDAELSAVLPLLLHRPPPGAHVPGQSENIRTVPLAIISPDPS